MTSITVRTSTFSAHIDDRTSDICTMLNDTIWALGDKDMQVPPLHFGCRSRLVPYFGKIPGKRDFKAQFGSEFVKSAEKTSTVFRKKYWSAMPHTKASATFQRSYFHKNEIKTITTGLNLAIKEERKRAIPNVVPLERLKSTLKYRKIDPDKSIIADRFGKSLMLDKFEERDIVRSIKSLITHVDNRITREVSKQKKRIDAAWKEVLSTRKSIAANERDIVYYQKRIKSDPASASDYNKAIAKRKANVSELKALEERKMRSWSALIDKKTSESVERLNDEKERYRDLLESFKFKKR